MLTAFFITAVMGILGVATSAAPCDDVLLFLGKSELLLDGYRLYKDIIDPNSPLIFYYNYPAIIFSRIVDIPPVLSLKIFTAVVTGIVLIFSYPLLKNVLKHESKNVAVALYVVTNIIFYFSWTNYIQRDYLITLFFFPYYLISTAYLLDKSTVPYRTQLVAGVMAGIGIMIKPTYIIVPALIELFILVKHWRISHILSVVNIALSMATITILTLFYLYIPEYFKVMWQALKYYSHYATAWDVSANVLIISIVIFGGVAFVIEDSNAHRTDLKRILYAFIIIAFAASLIQRKGFQYHYYMFIVFSTIYTFYILLPGKTNLKRGIKYYSEITTKAMLTLFVITRNLVIPYVLAYDSPWPSKGGWYESIIDKAAEYGKGGTYAVLSGCLYPYGRLDKERDISYAMRYLNLWFLPGLYKDSPDSIVLHQINEMSSDEKEYFDNVVSDIVTRKPKLLIVHIERYDCGFEGKKFEYIEYYSMNSEFRELMNEYKIVDSGNKIFTFYQRVSP